MLCNSFRAQKLKQHHCKKCLDRWFLHYNDPKIIMANLLHRRRAYTKNPVRWSAKEEQLALRLIKKQEVDDSFSWADIQSHFPSRTTPAIKSKLRKIRIKHDLFGRSYSSEKHKFLLTVANKAHPRIVFDAYAGSGVQTFLWAQKSDIIYASEKNSTKQKQFIARAAREKYKKKKSDLPGWVLFCRNGKKIYFWKGNALRAAIIASAHDRRADLLDLDTCGTTLPSLPSFLMLLRPRHLVISYGEFHSYRFGREDVLRRVLCHRSVNSSRMPSGIDKLADELHAATRMYGLRAGNELEDVFQLHLITTKWLGRNKGILRRYYKVTKAPAIADCLNELSHQRA